MEVSDAILQNLFGFAAALIGGAVGGWFTLKATDKAIKEENAKEDRQEEKEIQNLLDALGVEMHTLWNFHMQRVGAMIEQLPAGGALEFYYPLTQDYFTVYNTNASKIGQVREERLREAIVVCYNKAKKVVDGFKYNNELYRDWRDQADMSVDSREHTGRIAAKFKSLADYAHVIKEDHYELKEYVEHMLKLLDNRSHNN